jgi:hypothetical protein
MLNKLFFCAEELSFSHSSPFGHSGLLRGCEAIARRRRPLVDHCSRRVHPLRTRLSPLPCGLIAQGHDGGKRALSDEVGQQLIANGALRRLPSSMLNGDERHDILRY